MNKGIIDEEADTVFPELARIEEIKNLQRVTIFEGLTGNESFDSDRPRSTLELEVHSAPGGSYGVMISKEYETTWEGRDQVTHTTQRERTIFKRGASSSGELE